MSASVVGNVVVVTTDEEYERLIQLPQAIEGWFSLIEGKGKVTFKTVAAAQAARLQV